MADSEHTRHLPKPHPIKWFHDWEDRILIENWIPIRYQPILFVFLFTGIIFVVVRRPTLPSMSAMMGQGPAYFWLILALSCPPLLFISWLMIRWGSGRKTYYGYWMRFAADIGQTFSFIAFLIAMVSDPSPETEDAYAQILLASILAFLIVLVVRDILKLVLLERTSASVQRAQDQIDFNDAVEAAEVKHILDARDAHDVADVRAGIESTRQKVERNTLHLEQVDDDAAVSKERADDSEERESDWSRHQDHQPGNEAKHKADHKAADDAGS